MNRDGALSHALDDTHPAAKRVQLELLRKMGPARRLALALSLTSTVLSAHRDELLRAEPGLSDEELMLRLVARWYGAELANRVRAQLEQRRR